MAPNKRCASLPKGLVGTLPSGCCREDVKPISGRSGGPEPSVYTWGQTPIYNTRQLISTSKQTESVHKGDTGPCQQVSVIKHFKHSMPGIYS